MGVNYTAAILWLAAWALYLVAEAARTGSTAKADCGQDASGNLDDYYSRRCKGFSAAAAWDMFAALCAAVAAILVRGDQKLRNTFFVVSLAFYAVGLTCEWGGYSSGLDALGDDDQVTTLEHGYGGGAAFFFLAAIAAVVCAVMCNKGESSMWIATLSFFLFLGLFAIGWTSVFSGDSKANCDASSSNQDLQDAEDTRCSGNGFGGFVVAMAAVAGFWFTFLATRSKEDTAKLWVGWFTWAMLFFLAFTARYATEAQVYCNYLTGGENDQLCNGYSAAAFFEILAFVVAILGLVFSCRGMDTLKHSMFGVSFSLFFLAYTCYIGGFSSFYCKTADNADDAVDDDAYDIECDGFAAGTFFAVVAFVLSLVAGVFAYKGQSDASSDGQPAQAQTGYGHQDGNPAYAPTDDA